MKGRHNSRSSRKARPNYGRWNRTIHNRRMRRGRGRGRGKTTNGRHRDRGGRSRRRRKRNNGLRRGGNRYRHQNRSNRKHGRRMVRRKLGQRPTTRKVRGRRPKRSRKSSRSCRQKGRAELKARRRRKSRPRPRRNTYGNILHRPMQRLGKGGRSTVSKWLRNYNNTRPPQSWNGPTFRPILLAAFVGLPLSFWPQITHTAGVGPVARFASARRAEKMRITFKGRHTTTACLTPQTRTHTLRMNRSHCTQHSQNPQPNEKEG